MHTSLEQYLNDVYICLWGLPRKQRFEEICELRQHLTALVATDQDRGKTEAEAIQSAIQKFGPPATLGNQMARSWWRGRLQAWRDGCVGTAVVAALMFYVPSIIVGLLFPMRTVGPGVILQHLVPMKYATLWCLLVGGYIGWKMSPRTKGATVAAILSAVLLGNVLTPFLMWPVDQGMRLPHVSFSSERILGVLPMALPLLTGWAFSALLAMPAAFLGRSLARRSVAR